MSDLVFSLLFACMGMTFVFLVIMALTLAMLTMGYIMGKSPVPVKPARKKTTAPDTAAPPAEHVAVIAAAITIFRGGAPTQIHMLSDGDRIPWRADVGSPPTADRLQVLRRTR